MKQMGQDELLTPHTTRPVRSGSDVLVPTSLLAKGGSPCKVIRVGTSYRVVTADLRRVLGIAPS